jgi:hypothetical protein
MGEKWLRNFAESDDFHVTFGFFYMPKSTTWDRRLYFPSEGRRAEDFFALKNPTASAGFELANLGTKGQHTTSRPPKPLKSTILHFLKVFLPNFCRNSFIFLRALLTPPNYLILRETITLKLCFSIKHEVTCCLVFSSWASEIFWVFKTNICL